MTTLSETLPSPDTAAEATRALHEQVAAYATQVTLDFEELAWLRTMAGHLDCCRVDSSVDEVAREVLPSLCEVIGATRIVLFYTDHPESARSVDDYRMSWFGRGRHEEDDCRRLVESIRDRVESRPVVMNGPVRRASAPQLPEGAQSALAVSLTRHGVRFGWLVAFNKHTEYGDGIQRQLLGENEFGTIEAGMLGAAATLLSTHARNVHLFRAKEQLLVGTVRALVNAMDAKDHYTRGHSDRVAQFARCISRRMGLARQECEEIYMAGLLHDIGKIGVPDEVLRKPGKLTEEEFALIKLHPQIGHDILRNLKPLAYALPGVLHHHEAVDGSGYPYGLKGNDIPLPARILAVADSYDAMTSDRPYRPGMPTAKAESILASGASQQWDQAVVDAFFQVIEDIRAIVHRSRGRPDTSASEAETAAVNDSIASAVAETHA